MFENSLIRFGLSGERFMWDMRMYSTYQKRLLLACVLHVQLTRLHRNDLTDSGETLYLTFTHLS